MYGHKGVEESQATHLRIKKNPPKEKAKENIIFKDLLHRCCKIFPLRQ
jgi:hypothetical protein